MVLWRPGSAALALTMLVACGSSSRQSALDAAAEAEGGGTSGSSGSGATSASSGGSASSGSSSGLDAAEDSTLDSDAAPSSSSSSGSGSGSSGSSSGSTSSGDSGGPADAAFGADAPAPDSGGTTPDSGGNDAASSTCSSQCAPAAPSGWTGPFELYSGAASGKPAACPANAPNQVLSGYAGLNAPTPTCSTCGCTNSAPYCGLTLIASQGTSCNLFGCYETVEGRSDACGQTNCSGGETWYWTDYTNDRNPTPVAGWGTTSTPQTGTVEPYSWSSVALGCAVEPPSSAGCGGGLTCVPTPTAPFATAMCVLRSGSVACPTTTFTVQSTFYTGAMDTRACVGCGCTEGSGVTCSGTLSFFSDSACQDSVASTTSFSPGVCSETTPAFQSWKLTNVTFTGTPSSTPNGGNATGYAIPTGPLTVCCTP